MNYKSTLSKVMLIVLLSATVVQESRAMQAVLGLIPGFTVIAKIVTIGADFYPYAPGLISATVGASMMVRRWMNGPVIKEVRQVGADVKKLQGQVTEGFEGTNRRLDDAAVKADEIANVLVLVAQEGRGNAKDLRRGQERLQADYTRQGQKLDAIATDAAAIKDVQAAHSANFAQILGLIGAQKVTSDQLNLMIAGLDANLQKQLRELAAGQKINTAAIQAQFEKLTAEQQQQISDFISKLGELKAGQDETNKRLGGLETGQAEILQRLDNLASLAKTFAPPARPRLGRSAGIPAPDVVGSVFSGSGSLSTVGKQDAIPDTFELPPAGRGRGAVLALTFAKH